MEVLRHSSEMISLAAIDRYLQAVECFWGD
jgi:hypothetical protein